ncbi:MAG: hypothetical protein MUO26_04255 [Methanotrichaceae archaeon]|nr:hypothetical protein [Methanotrichaceae archaeon]
MANTITISPEPVIQKCKSLAKAKNLYVDMKDRCIRLAWTSISDDGSSNNIEYIDRIEAVRLAYLTNCFLMLFQRVVGQSISTVIIL